MILFNLIAYTISLVADTDSVFVQFCKEILDLPRQQLFEKAGQISQQLSKDLFTAPIQLEFEKVYQPLLMLKKKK
jgi:DNA polymerase elongation subunit (family B)